MCVEGLIDSIVLSADSLPLKLNQLSLSEVRFSMKLCKEDLPVNIFKSVEGIFDTTFKVISHFCFNLQGKL